MNNLLLALQGAWQVLLAGLVLGAGLPTVFALGIRALSYGTHDQDEAANDHRPHPLAKVIAGLCFAIVLAAIALGIGTIVAHGFGMTLTFNGIIPTFEPH